MITRKQKQQVVKDLEKIIDESQGVVFTSFDKILVDDLREFRKKLRDGKCGYQVAKKNLIKIALENKKIKGVDLEDKQGSLGVGFSKDDEVAPIKEVADFSKENESFVYFAGIVDGKVVEEVDLKQLAILPGKDQLRGQVVGTIAAPISGFVNVLAGNMRGLVNVLNGIKDAKESA